MGSVFDKYLGSARPAEQPAGSVFDDYLPTPDWMKTDPSLVGKTLDTGQPGALEAAGRGALQGASAGFFDEAAAGLRSLVDAKDIRQLPGEYHKNIATERSQDAAAQEAHPWAYGAGELGGGLATAAIPGASFAGRGLGGAVKTGAAYGAVAGAGGSEADSIAGVTGDALKGGAFGALAGGAVHAVGTVAGKVAEGAQERLDRRLLSEIGDKATPTTRQRLALKDEDKLVVNTARKYGLDEVAKDPVALKEANAAAKTQVGEARSAVLAEADQLDPGVPLAKMMRAMHKVEQEYDKNPATKDLAKKIAAKIEDMRTNWRDYPGLNGVARVPSKEVNAFATSLGNEGFAGSMLDPKTAKVMQRKAWGAVKDVLDEHVSNVLGEDAAKNFAQLGKEYSVLMDIGAAADKRATLTKFEPTGIRDIANSIFSPGHLFLSGHPIGAIGKLAYNVAAPRVGKAVDTALAALVKAARTGTPKAALLEQAALTGVPASVAEKVAAWSVRPAEVAP